jgi:hypothetical protein
MSTEQPTPRELKQGIADKLAMMPANPDHNGHHDLDRAADAATIARLTAPDPVADPEPHAMLPNRAQGSGATVSTPPPANPLAAVRAKLAKLNNI